MRWPIRWQILVPFSGVTLVTLGIVSGVNAYLASRIAEQAIVRQLRGIGQTLRDATFPLSEPVLLQAAGLSGAEFVVTDSAGRVTAATLPVGRVFHPSSASAAPRTLGSPLVVNKTYYLYSQVRRRANGGRATAQLLHVLYPQRDWRLARQRAVWPPLVMGFIALVGISVLALIVARRISAPIERLKHQVGQMADGDYRPLDLPQRADELCDLVAATNQLAARLKWQTQTIQRAERFALLGQLSSGLAHQLRNSITGARLAIQLHQEACRSSDSETLDQALHQLGLTEDDLRRLLRAGGSTELTTTSQRVGATIARTIEAARPLAAHLRVTLTATTDAADLVVMADHAQLQHALSNLVQNAIEAAAPEGTVRVDWSPADADGVCIRVADTGKGVAAAVADRLFEPFVSTKPEGVGLGLMTAHRIVTQHGGRLRYYRDGETTFELVLPRMCHNTAVAQAGNTDDSHEARVDCR